MWSLRRCGVGWWTVAMALLALAGAAAASPFAYIPVTDAVTVIDTATNGIVATIPVDHVGSGVAIHPSGRRVYVAAQDGVAEIDALTNTVVRVIHAGIDPAGVAVSPTGDRLYVVNHADAGSVSAIDTASGSVVATVPVGNVPLAIAVSPDAQQLYVINTRDFTEHPPCSANPLADCPPMSIVDALLDQEDGRLTIGVNPTGVAVDPIDGRVVVGHQAPNSKTLLLDGALAVIDPRTRGTITDVPLSNPFPSDVAVHPDGRRVYVTQSSFVQAGGVSVVDLMLASETTFIPVGNGSLEGIAFNPSGTRAYAVHESGRSLVVIDTATATVITSIALEDTPHAFGQFVGPELPPLSPTPTVSAAPGTPTPTPPSIPSRTPTEFYPACCLTNTCPTLNCQCGNTCDGRPCGAVACPDGTFRDGFCAPSAIGVGCQCLAECPSLTPTPTPLPSGECVGDCKGNGEVTVNELLTLVNIALGNAPVSACDAGDANHDGRISVDEILTAVDNALNGCLAA